MHRDRLTDAQRMEEITKTHYLLIEEDGIFYRQTSAYYVDTKENHPHVDYTDVHHRPS